MVALSKVILLLCLTFTQAHPGHHQRFPVIASRAQLSKRTLPQFINFTPNDSSNPKIASLTQGFKDMVTVVNVVINAANTDEFNTIFLKYFPNSNMKAAVIQVFTNMVQPATNSPETGADRLSGITVDANDYANLAQYMALYTTSRETAADVDQMHLTDTAQKNAYAYPALSAITCGAGGEDTGTIGTVVSDKMLSLGGYALVHELTHAGVVFPSTSQAMTTLTSETEAQDYAYGPQHCRQLAAGQGKNGSGAKLLPKWALINADNYAWFANEVYWTITCKRPFGDPTDNSYTPRGVDSAAAGGQSAEL